MSLKISNKIIGFDREFKLLKSLFEHNKLPQNIMFQGIDGIGKYTMCINLICNFLKKNTSDPEEKLNKDANVLILNSELNNFEFKLDDTNKIINFCQLKSLDEKPKFIIMKNSNYLNTNAVNSLLKIIEEPKENVYFLFTCNSLNQNINTLNSRFFIKKLFLNNKFYKEIIDNFSSYNNLEKISDNYDLQDSPGVFLRKYFYNLNPNLEKLKKNNQTLFYDIISNKVLKTPSNNLKLLKKLKLNLSLNNDIKKIINKFI